jgi:hypothetical protein
MTARSTFGVDLPAARSTERGHPCHEGGLPMRFLLVVSDPDRPELDTYAALLIRSGVLLADRSAQPRSWLIEARTAADAQAWAARCATAPVEVQQIP